MSDFDYNLSKGMMIEALVDWPLSRRLLKGERAVIIEVLKVGTDNWGKYHDINILNSRGSIFRVRIRFESVRIVRRLAS